MQDLRIDIPELEPDPVLLAQLSQLSAASVARPKDGPARVLVAGVTVLILACFAWLTGAVPGVASPFDGVRDPRPAPHAPRTTPTPDDQVAEAGAPSSASAEALVAPGQVRTDHDQGNHTGLTRPNHHDNGNHTGLYGAQHDNGNHTGQTRPHTNQGNHTGQTRPHTNQGNHHGQTKPHQHGHHDQPPTGPGNNNGNGNGQRE